jgi:hypothetical protein
MTEQIDDPQNRRELPPDVFRIQTCHNYVSGRAGTPSRESSEIDALWSNQAGRVLHEFRVHHIELEMQNEELRATWERIGTSKG